MKHQRIITIWLTISSLVACAPFNHGTTTTPKPMTATEAITPTVVFTQTPDVVINVRQFNQLITIKLGEILKVEPPDLNTEWQVGYDPILFEFATDPKIARAPGLAGWLFRAVATGKGQIVLTSIVSCSKPPCPLMPIRFQLAIQVQ